MNSGNLNLWNPQDLYTDFFTFYYSWVNKNKFLSSRLQIM